MKPPWIQYPGYSPGDPFWRQSGELWFSYVWQPYFQNLTDDEKKRYLQEWKPPQEWQVFYFDEEWQGFLHSVDDDE